MTEELAERIGMAQPRSVGLNQGSVRVDRKRSCATSTVVTHRVVGVNPQRAGDSEAGDAVALGQRNDELEMVV
jgi:hypothetical protein